MYFYIYKEYDIYVSNVDKNGEQCNLYANLQFSISNIYMFDYKFAEASATWIEAAACGGSSCYLPVRL